MPKQMVDSKSNTFSYSAPASISSNIGSNFFIRNGAAPVNKEWGVGERFVGQTMVGGIATSTGNNLTMSWSTPRSAVVGGEGTFFLDPYAALPAIDPVTGSSSNTKDTCFSLHPSNIPRLAVEALNWGRYVFRGLQVEYFPATSTQNEDSIVSAVTHDVSWPLNLDQLSVAFGDVLDLNPSVITALWKAFKIRVNDYKGDRTWSTTMPSILLPTGYTNWTTGSFISSFLEDFVQYAVINRLTTAAASSSNSSCGYMLVKYVVDFYGPKSDTNNRMEAVLAPSGTGSFPGPSSSSGSLSSSKYGFTSHPGIISHWKQSFRVPAHPSIRALRGTRISDLVKPTLASILKKAVAEEDVKRASTGRSKSLERSDRLVPRLPRSSGLVDKECLDPDPSSLDPDVSGTEEYFDPDPDTLRGGRYRKTTS